MKKLLLAGSILIIGTGRSMAQGCSDAGVCTIHSFKNNTSIPGEKDNTKNDLLIGFAFGKGERDISYYTPYIEYTRSITGKTSVTAKINYSSMRGELVNVGGIGDLFLSVNHAFDVKHKWKKSFVVGLKIPFDDADKVKDGIHLPLPYQASLGTTDLILGLNFIRKSLGVTLAVQQPLKPINGNKFLPEDYPSVPLANRYLPTNEFTRKGDVLLRTSYNFELNKKFSLRPSLLSIYHETNDTYVDGSKVRREIEKSAGLTLNGNIFANYKLNNTSELELSLGAPFVVRTNRPDGLTRHFVASVEYKFSF
jgi:hypothetical protein